MESKKSSNVSSDQTRALSGIKLHGKNYVEKSLQPLLILRLNSSRKLDISGDQNSVKEIGKHMALVQQFESLLLSSYSKGVLDNDRPVLPSLISGVVGAGEAGIKL